MKNLTTLVILIVALASGIVSFLYARGPDTAATTRRRPPMSHLLDLSAEQESAIGKADPNFRGEAGELAMKLDAEQDRLAELLEDSGAARETSHSIVCQKGGSENMPFDYLCIQCGKMLPIETIDVDGLAQRFRNSAIPSEDQELPEIGNTTADFDLRVADQGAMTMAEVVEDFDEPNQPLVQDNEVPFTHPDSDLHLAIW